MSIPNPRPLSQIREENADPRVREWLDQLKECEDAFAEYSKLQQVVNDPEAARISNAIAFLAMSIGVLVRRDFL